MYPKRLLLALTLLICTLLPPGTLLGQEASLFFPETGHSVRGIFKEHWEQNGGLAIFGYPVTDELWQDGRTVQYFERNRFEHHPQNSPPYHVLLGRLGEDRLRASARDWRALQVGTPAPDCLFFPETAHSLCEPFRSYWEQGGGLAVFGYPLSEPMLELSETDGRTYQVQYFERNRFEHHPELAPPYDVLLGLLGSWHAQALLGSGRSGHQQIRAAIHGPREVQEPLAELTLTVEAPGYGGPATLRVLDGAGRVEQELALTIVDGQASVALRAGGALGPHAAVLLIDGAPAGISSAAYVLDAETELETGIAPYDRLLPRVHQMLQHDISEYEIDGFRVRGYRSPDSPMLWLRDHVYQALGYRYFERDMTSLLDYFRRAQREDGSFDDYVYPAPYGLVKGRQEVEADLEFLFVQGVYQAWQATGDSAWLQANKQAMERGIAYITGDALRWEPQLELVKRPFTIDTWDFEYRGPNPDPSGRAGPRDRIDEHTKWGIMHGDNTGLAYALLLLGRIEEGQGDVGQAASRYQQARELMQRLNALSWNGSFFRHQVHLTPVVVPGLNEERQLSLSNAYALNREVLSASQATAIVDEYERRYQNRGANFAEWFSIDPPFPPNSFGMPHNWGDQPGEYVNGGIMPLVGGELARGAFRWGRERYGFDILQRYSALLEAQGGSYLWYYPNGAPGLAGADTLKTDGWGSTAMLAALFEGAAGVVDRAALYETALVAPRWAADPAVQQARVTTRYGASLGYMSYRWERREGGISLHVTGSHHGGQIQVLLPEGTRRISTVLVDGVSQSYQQVLIGGSAYVQIPLSSTMRSVDILW